VPWAKKDDFLRAILPDVERNLTDVRRLTRKLPEKHPRRPLLFADGAELVKGVGFPDSDGQDPNWLWFSSQAQRGSGMAEIRVTWRHLTYQADVEDDQTTPPNAILRPAPELKRYITRYTTPNVEATNIGGSIFKFVRTAGDIVAGVAASDVGTETPAKILPFTELKYVWHMVPGIPPAVLREFNGTIYPGTVNRVSFDVFALGGVVYAPGTLLFLGAEISEPYLIGAGFTEVRDITYTFTHRPQGWNFLYRRGVGFREVTTDAVSNVALTDDKNPYNWTSHETLFTFG